ncbi:penicillin-binding transpeptidase domain-containing protein [Microbacterium sp. zg.Y1090]|uniref:peptidoglycan D,D-transpeptidase FtsI family protein n=1 Tax=Microbacterium TaxID=33882 RepID=UPI00214CF9D9|nr:MULTISPECIES: penicillin-binding transpeptidase domain-containing protein [unclassified Microbacterium]MCR2813024.1 penicillin-binding transpeptidase domain-containing protein [Microbacterium sp. zg.Y1084]MCR2819357.1 penicillin-binding transpeptidase domain-containing protein [Microbacterium sp. zg.Y1090]MDL5487274.1 penicillin-binding transpeptidase domain-containing protein [Microbacterium sp. zg-Y1211]WIM28337.1 penicillin-binding transpeptidase domain-containing protein [Microbacterium 
MTKELRRLSMLVLAMFLALFVSTSVIQVVQADDLSANPLNRRALYDTFEVQRGAIIASGAAIAASVPTDDLYSWQRVYTDPYMWAPVTGFINPVLGSATGMERAMNQELSGTADSQFLARIEQIISGQQPRGSNVVLTLDAAAQRAAFEALGDLQGAVVAIEPATGRILAMVSSPSYDTNLLAVHDAAAVEATEAALLDDPLQPLDNRAIAGRLNPPGSTFKLVVASAALSTGEWTAQSTLPNPAAYTLPQSSSIVRNAGGGTCGPGEEVTIADALRLSCNIPFAELAVRLGDDVIRDEAEKFGFDSSFTMPLESTPSVYPTVLDDAQTALSGFGQGDVRATPLQMAMVSAGIAHQGVVMNPRMVEAIIAADFTQQQSFDDTEYGRAVSEEVAASMTRMMVANVQTGIASGATIDGVDVAGKTGTAENGVDDPYTLWFTGFAPADDPRVAVAVVVENGGGLGQSGSSNRIAAPIAAKVMEAVLSR